MDRGWTPANGKYNLGNEFLIKDYSLGLGLIQLPSPFKGGFTWWIYIVTSEPTPKVIDSGTSSSLEEAKKEVEEIFGED